MGVLGPLGFRTLRLDRNRNLITADEQRRLGGLRIGVAGLSVGHVIAHTLVAEGLCGEIRLADFDTLELSNLNRIPATILDLGENKAVLAARRIAELEEVKRLLVLTFIESGRWDWTAAWTTFRTGRLSGKSSRRIGFSSEQVRPLSASELPNVPHTSAVIRE